MPQRHHASRRRRHWAVRLAGWLTGALLAGIVLLTAAFFIGYATTDIPDPNAGFAANTTVVTYADGKRELGAFYDQNRQSIALREVPPHVQNALIAAEDRSYWSNPGISLPGMARAAIAIVRGDQLQGGSTITQQYVKVLYLDQERTLSRKLDELFIATKLSRTQSKEAILEGYLNTIYFGEGAWGIRAAGQTYFGVQHPRDLTVSQAAYLAAVLNNPTRFDPDNPAAAKRTLSRYRYVLRGMLDMSALAPGPYAAARKALPQLKRNRPSRYAGPSGFLLDMARRELARYGFDGDLLSRGGLRVVTTFDYQLQARAVATVRSSSSAARVGLASIRTGTGELAALYGGPDFVRDQRNWATTKAPPGSTIRPFAAIATGGALKSGQTTDNSLSRTYHDLVRKKRGHLVASAAERAGFPRIPGAARLDPGSGPDPLVSPVDLAAAYAVFVQDGRRVPVHVIKEVRNRHGKVVWAAEWQRSLRPAQVFEPGLIMDLRNRLTLVQDRMRLGLPSPAPGRSLYVPEGQGQIGGAGSAVGLSVEKRRFNFKCRCRRYKGAGDILATWYAGADARLSTAIVYRAGPQGESAADQFLKYPDAVWRQYLGQ